MRGCSIRRGVESPSAGPRVALVDCHSECLDQQLDCWSPSLRGSFTPRSVPPGSATPRSR
jgi:hypothetical protein